MKRSAAFGAGNTRPSAGVSLRRTVPHSIPMLVSLRHLLVGAGAIGSAAALSLHTGHRAAFAQATTLRSGAAVAASPPGGLAIIVGVSNVPGVGHSVAKRFAKEGLVVALFGRQEARLAESKAAITTEVPGAIVTTAVVDATDATTVRSTVGALVSEHGPVSAMVYNAAPRPFPPTKIVDLDPARVQSEWAISVIGALNSAQAVLPSMREVGCGTLIFTGASASMRGGANFGSFCIAKRGMRMLAQSLAKELNSEG